MSNQLEVEVTLRGSSIYKAFLEDIAIGENAAKVVFEKGKAEYVLLENIRFPPEDSDDDHGFKKGNSVEIRQYDSKQDVFYWRKAILSDLDLNTCQYSVLLEGLEPHKVKLSDIRHVNDSPTISQSRLTKIEIQIPENLASVAKNPDMHAEFQKQVKADFCKFIPAENILRLISRQGEYTRKKAHLLRGLHLQHLEEEFQYTSSQAADSNFIEIFEVSEKFMGLALGKRHSNLKEAQKIKDVTSVKLIDNTLNIRICGKTAEAVKAARNMVEYQECYTSIPRHLAEEILEDGGKIISDIVEQSGLVRIESGEDEDEFCESVDYPIIFVGTPPCIENAKALLDYQIKLAERKLNKKQASVSEPKAVPADPNLVVERIPMKKELMGLALGKNRANVKKAEQIPGVVKIEVPSQMPMFIIYAKNQEAAKSARELLEYDEDTVVIAQSSLGKIIGRNGSTVKNIERLFEGVRVRIPSRNQNSSSAMASATITVVGPAKHVPKAINLVKQVEAGTFR